MTKNTEPNRLAQETSPYLREHAHNPVDWYPWGEEAFARARAEDKPVFLSIGYASCHWCHVMAREVFEDEEAAAKLNNTFIAIKADREQRPDIDGVYQRALLALTGGGGWPASLFLDTQGRPFFAGTYIPKQTFLRILDAVNRAWKNDRESLLLTGQEAAAAAEESMYGGAVGEGHLLENAAAAYAESFDREYGGFGRAPKFPAPHNLYFLLEAGQEMAEKTLVAMYRGGLFDHVGGGFFRYSTDRRWLIPHFEKMLYDNALLATAYLLAYEKTKVPTYLHVAERTLAFLERAMSAPDGGFHAALDADSEGEEGRYYVFEPGEIRTVLGEEMGERFCRHFGITQAGNFEGKSLPNLLSARGEDPDAEALLPRVLEYRGRRIPPSTDTNILTAWNALAAAAFAASFRITKNIRHMQTARELLDYLERTCTQGTMVFTGVSEGKRMGPGFLDDYAYLIYAYLQMHQATLEAQDLARAAELADSAWDHFWDKEAGGFFFSGTHNETLIARPKETWDGAMPSGNSVMAYALSRLALLTEEERFREREEAQNRFMEREASRHPSGYGFYLWSRLPVKKVVCAPAPQQDVRGLQVASDWAFRLADGPAYPVMNGETTYYVCEGQVCQPPRHRV